MPQQLEMQIVQALLGLLVAGVTAAVGVLLPKVQKFFTAHTGAAHATQANAIVSGLGSIAESVVQDFNQRIVTDAKKNGVWGAQLASSVKKDAVAAVLDQGANLVALGGKVLGNAEGLVSSLVEQAVGKFRVTTSVATTLGQSASA